jgi:sulfite reductase (NADPH) hemoprotein beta-component
MTLKALTASRLLDGAVVYLAEGGGWSERIAESRVATNDDEDAGLLAEAEGSVERQLVVAPYLFAVALEDGVVRPLGQREIVRAEGSDLDHRTPGR